MNPLDRLLDLLYLAVVIGLIAIVVALLPEGM